jgi:hypothetical protein
VRSRWQLAHYGVRYWLNPNEVLAADSYSFNLADAASICLEDCPQARTQPRIARVACTRR